MIIDVKRAPQFFDCHVFVNVMRARAQQPRRRSEAQEQRPPRPARRRHLELVNSSELSLCACKIQVSSTRHNRHN